MWAAHNGHLECARLLLDAGADKNVATRVRIGRCDGFSSCVSVLFNFYRIVYSIFVLLDRGGWLRRSFCLIVRFRVVVLNLYLAMTRPWWCIGFFFSYRQFNFVFANVLKMMLAFWVWWRVKQIYHAILACYMLSIIHISCSEWPNCFWFGNCLWRAWRRAAHWGALVACPFYPLSWLVFFTRRSLAFLVYVCSVPAPRNFSHTGMHSWFQHWFVSC